MIENLSNVQGLIILTIQAHCKSFQPNPGRDPSPSQEAMLYAGLYAMAIGVGGVKASLPTHGADQLDHSNKRAISSFFNWFFFSLCTGGLLAVTLLVWVQENKGWQWGFTISAVTLFLGFCIFAGGLPFYRHKFPNGSPFIRIFKVIVGHPSMKLWGNWIVAKYLNWMTRIELKVLGMGPIFETAFRSMDFNICHAWFRPRLKLFIWIWVLAFFI